MFAATVLATWLVVQQLCSAGPAIYAGRGSGIIPLTRRSPLDKNFMRFGRSDVPQEGDHLAEPTREIKKKSNFIRFGRGDDNPVVEDANLSVLSKGDLPRLGNARDNIMRFGWGENEVKRAGPAKENFMRFGRPNEGFMRFGRDEGNYMRFERGEDDFMKFVRANDNFMRLGRGGDDFTRLGGAKDNFMRFGRAKDNFMRFGRAKNNFMKYGHSIDELQVRPSPNDVGLSYSEWPKEEFFRGRRSERLERSVRDRSLVRTGRHRQSSEKGDGFMRFGRSGCDPETLRYWKAGGLYAVLLGSPELSLLPAPIIAHTQRRLAPEFIRLG